MTNPDLNQTLSDALFSRHSVDAARVLERLTPEQARQVCRSASPALVAPVMAQMDPVLATQILHDLDSDHGARVLRALPGDDAGVMLRRLSDERRNAILTILPAELSITLRRCLTYPDDHAGALLDPTVLTASSSQTVRDALASVARAGSDAHFYLFVVDRFRTLVGVVSLRELFTAPPAAVIGAIAKRDVSRIRANADRAAILAHPAWQHFHALPVVDDEARFLGVIRHETVRRLEAGRAATSPGQATLSLALELGELAWAWGGDVLSELSAAVAPSPTETRRRA